MAEHALLVLLALGTLPAAHRHRLRQCGPQAVPPQLRHRLQMMYVLQASTSAAPTIRLAAAELVAIVRPPEAVHYPLRQSSTQMVSLSLHPQGLALLLQQLLKAVRVRVLGSVVLQTVVGIVVQMAMNVVNSAQQLHRGNQVSRKRLHRVPPLSFPNFRYGLWL
jgi:hypothetical protein